jgi:hypothetical protein
VSQQYKLQILLVKNIQFIVKSTFKAPRFGSTEPSSGLFVRTDPITSTFGIPSVYNDGIPNVLAIGYRSVESKHVALNVSLTIKVDVFDKKNSAIFIYSGTHRNDKR